MALQIGDHTLGGLKLAAEQEALEQLTDAVMRTAISGTTDAPPTGSVAVKSSFAAILTLILEAARSDASAADITPVLEQAGWPSASVSSLGAQYTSHKSALRVGVAGAPGVPLSSLSSTSFPSVVDVSWRVDDYLRSDGLDAVRQPTFLLSLATQSSSSGSGGMQGDTQQIPFACNFQQLQDLLAKLKDAQKQIQQRVE